MPQQPEKKLVDLAPTWETMLPILFHLLDNSDVTGEEVAREQFLKMAQTADKWNAHCKQLKEDLE